MYRSNQPSSSHFISTNRVSIKRPAEPQPKYMSSDKVHFTARTLKRVCEDLGNIPRVHLPFTLTMPEVIPLPKIPL